MAQLAIKLRRPNLILVDGEYLPSRALARPGTKAKLSQEMLTLAFVMMILQIVDGILTAIGISHLGISAEGNLLLRVMMEHLGYIPTLVLVKTLALFVIAALCFISMQVNWITKAMRLMIVVYLGAAIIPWSAIILLKII